MEKQKVETALQIDSLKSDLGTLKKAVEIENKKQKGKKTEKTIKRLEKEIQAKENKLQEKEKHLKKLEEQNQNLKKRLWLTLFLLFLSWFKKDISKINFVKWFPIFKGTVFIGGFGAIVLVAYLAQEPLAQYQERQKEQSGFEAKVEKAQEKINLNQYDSAVIYLQKAEEYPIAKENDNQEVLAQQYESIDVEKYIAQFKPELLDQPNIAGADNEKNNTLRESYVKFVQKVHQALSQKINQYPDSADFYLKRGILFGKGGQLDNAVQDFSKAISLDSSIVATYIWRGAAYRILNKSDLALVDFNQAIQINSNDATFYNNRGDLYNDLQKHDLALVDYTKAIQINPNRAKFYNNRGFIYEKLQKYDLALADFNKTIELDSNNAAAYNNRGSLHYHHTKNYDLALADFNKAIQINPNDATPYNNRGSLYENMQKYDLALADYTKAIQINPNDAMTYNNRGNLYYEKLNEPQKALADYNKFIQLNPNNGYSYYNRGNLYYHHTKNYDLALADFNKAIQIDPNDEKAYSYRAASKIKLNDPKGACQDAQKAKSLGLKDAILEKFIKENCR